MATILWLCVLKSTKYNLHWQVSRRKTSSRNQAHIPSGANHGNTCFPQLGVAPMCETLCISKACQTLIAQHFYWGKLHRHFLSSMYQTSDLQSQQASGINTLYNRLVTLISVHCGSPLQMGYHLELLMVAKTHLCVSLSNDSKTLFYAVSAESFLL